MEKYMIVKNSEMQKEKNLYITSNPRRNSLNIEEAGVFTKDEIISLLKENTMARGYRLIEVGN